ncbi:MAG TPA: MmcQ/YjbR family DNA-binding protein [Kofleriaceae bacterium]|nr:MmcQ/YjbR family DNA-binding protein [Kofleriaceae bacterium]
MPTRAAVALERVRKLCLALPETSERASHGSPSFFIRRTRSFVSFVDNHHGDGRLALWCAAPAGAQAMLVESNSEVYFVPPYVGVSGWIGVRLDRRAPWPEIGAIVEQAFRARAPVTVLRLLDHD